MYMHILVFFPMEMEELWVENQVLKVFFLGVALNMQIYTENKTCFWLPPHPTPWGWVKY